MPREPKCKMCGTVIVEMLVEVSPAADTVCLECSGATIEDFMEAGLTDEDHLENEVEALRIFHGKDR